MIIKKESDLKYVRFKLEHTYSCYLCGWVGGDNDVGKDNKIDEDGRGYVDNKYCSLYCPKCFNELLSTEYQKVYYG